MVTTTFVIIQLHQIGTLNLPHFYCSLPLSPQWRLFKPTSVFMDPLLVVLSFESMKFQGEFGGRWRLKKEEGG